MTSQRSTQRQRGSILFVGMAVSVVLLLTMAAAIKTTFVVGKSVQHEIDRTAAMAIAEGVAEIAQKVFRDQVANFESPDLEGVVVLAGEEYAYNFTPVGSPTTEVGNDGVVTNVERYSLTTTVEHGVGMVRLERVVDVNSIPMYQFMIYYAGDLEVLPGPDMTLSGRVHANGDIYIGAGNTLTVDTDYFHSTGSVYRRRKNDGSESGGTVRIKVKDQVSYENMLNEFDGEYSDWTQYALDTWDGTVQDGSHGITKVAAPEIGSIKAYQPDGTKGFFHENAGLVIVDDRAYDSAGNSIDVSGAMRERSFFDAREGKTVTVTELDMGALNASGHYPSNGLVYAYRTDASPDQPNGIRLVNAAELAGPLTVVTEDPLYVQGDFNTVNKKGAAVIADAVNLLSNSWSDTGGLMQSASETSYNMAFVTGNVPTPDGGGTYSGGFENLPRFHENWSGVRANIRGSFVNMFESEIARSPWGMRNVYSPPIREWHYDPDLTDPKNLPPFTPNAVSVEKVYWTDQLPYPFAVN